MNILPESSLSISQSEISSSLESSPSVLVARSSKLVNDESLSLVSLPEPRMAAMLKLFMLCECSVDLSQLCPARLWLICRRDGRCYCFGPIPNSDLKVSTWM